MTIPSALIVVPFLASFLICMVRYYLEDSGNRLTHPCFLVGASAVLLTILYLVLGAVIGAIFWMSLLFVVLAFASLALAVHLFRRVPPAGSIPGGG